MNIKKILAKTDQGNYLQINQDFMIRDIQKNIYLIGDGIGGSGIADKDVEKGLELIVENYQKFSADPNKTLPFYFSPSYLPETNSLINSLLIAHKDLLQRNNSKDMNARSAFSLLGFVLFDDNLTLISVGNCSSYLYRSSQLIKMFEEDSLMLYSKDDNDDGLKLVPSSAVGIYSELYYQVREMKIQPNDKIALFTDGVSAYLSSEEIIEVLSTENLKLDEKVNGLMSLAQENGSYDNQTSLLVEF